MKNRYQHLSVAIPMMDEWENLEMMLAQLRGQRYGEFSVYVCVNQPDDWWQGDGEQRRICQANMDTLRELHGINDLEVITIDRCSPTKGWSGKRKGVGWARKELMELIASQRPKDELIVSLDGDTAFEEDYFEKLVDSMNDRPEVSAIAVPYYHPLSGVEALDRGMLRYECYMRYYLINLLRIGNPYAFSALGSAMAFPLWAYERVGGITPLQGGEDFYLMQKFCKTGCINLGINTLVKPQGRISHRVPFGTGPAVAAGLEVQREKYPFFALEGFEAVAKTYSMLSDLYDGDRVTPMTDFMKGQLKTEDLWGPLRRNFKTRELFVRGCVERLDGLRILQYLKGFRSGEGNFMDFMDRMGIGHGEDFDFERSSIAEMDGVRNELFEMELGLRKMANGGGKK